MPAESVGYSTWIFSWKTVGEPASGEEDKEQMASMVFSLFIHGEFVLKG
jgi:hypothetical protein